MKSKQNSNPEPREDNVDEQTKLNIEAFSEAENDIEEDPELNDDPEPGDDLDEGELARFEGEQ